MKYSKGAERPPDPADLEKSVLSRRNALLARIADHVSMEDPIPPAPIAMSDISFREERLFIGFPGGGSLDCPPSDVGLLPVETSLLRFLIHIEGQDLQQYRPQLLELLSRAAYVHTQQSGRA